jgi:hypothetical protein
MLPLEKVLSRLPSARRRGDQYEALCPAHRDRRASLVISTAEDGRVLLCCHAFCRTEDVVAALGLTWGDLFPSTANRHDSLSSEWSAVALQPVNLPWPPKNKKVHSTPEKAALTYRMGYPNRSWVYQAADGTEVGRVLRWDLYAGKEVRPLARVPGGWLAAAPQRPRGIYRLPEVLGQAEARVWLCEGEKCADWVTSLGLLGTCTWGGANGADHADLSHLSGRMVVIVPDHNDPGIKYAQTCIRRLKPIAASLEVVPPKCFPWGKDIADLETEAALAALGSATKDLSLVGFHDDLDRGSSPNDSQEGEPC